MKILNINNAVFKFLRGPGNSSDMNVNGSVTPVEFTYTPPADKATLIYRILILVTDTNMGYEEFAGLGAALTNGIEVKVFDDQDVEVLDFLDGETITVNEEWSLLAGPDIHLTEGAQAEAQPVRWTLANAGGPFLLQEGYVFKMIINDNLTTVDEIRATIQGYTIAG